MNKMSKKKKEETRNFEWKLEIHEVSFSTPLDEKILNC
jgi:hypothetical protein